MKNIYSFILLFVLVGYSVISKAQVGGGTKQQIQNFQDNATSAVLPTVIAVDKYADRAKKAFDEVVENNAFQTILNGSSATLPFAIKKDGVPYMIIIDSIVMMKKDAYVTAYCVYENPKNPAEKFVFAGSNIRFTKKGGFTGTGILELVEAPPIKIGPSSDPYLSIQLMSQYVGSGENNWVVKPSRRTFVEFDCNGFKELNIDADITFNKKHVWAENPDGKVMKDTSLTVSFRTNITSGSGWLIDLNNVPKFQFRKLPGYTFEIEEAAFDNHTALNPSNLSFPDNYGADNLGMAWTGFFGSNIKMWLPRGFKKKKEGDVPDSLRVYISLNRVIFDDFGFSVDADAGGEGGTPLISSDETAHKWKLTLQELHLEIVKNQFKRLEFNGTLELPIQDDNEEGDDIKAFDYDGLVAFNETTKNLDYRLHVELQDDITADCFKIASITLEQNSSITATYTDDRFDFVTDLNGSFSINSKKDGGGNGVELGIKFEGLRLATYHEYLKVRKLYVNKDLTASIGNTEISLSGIGLKSRTRTDDMSADTTQKGISFTIGVEFNGEENGSSFGGSGGFTIWAKRMKDTEKWKFVGVELDRIVIDVKNDFYTLYGELNRGDDTCWGNYYSGTIDMTLMEGKIRVAADGRFGQKKVNGTAYKYWGVNGFVGGFKIPLGPAFGLNMFSGGLTKGMAVVNPDEVTDDGGDCEKIWHCRSTDMNYVFDHESGLSVMAGVGLQSLPTPTVFAGSVYFSVGFYADKGGVKSIGFKGGVGFFATPGEVPLKDSTAIFSNVNTDDNKSPFPIPTKPTIMGMGPDNPPKLTLAWDMNMDFENKTFRGDFDIWAKVNVGGFDILKGKYDADGYAGNMKILFSPDDWYIWIGQPIMPIALEANLVIVKPSVSTYFVVGSILPDPPIAPNPFGSRFKTPTILKDALVMGGGVAFGTRMDIDAFLGIGARDKKPCSIKLGVDLWASAGFDLLMQKSKGAVACIDGPSERGVDNWYAMGQLYFGAGAKFVVGAKCFGVGYDFNAASIELYLYLAGQFPNPNYFYGRGQGEVDIAGIVTVDFDFDVEFGKRCITAANINNRVIKVISQMSPGRSTENVSIYTKPQVFFEFALEQEVIMNLENPGGAYTSGTPMKVRPVFNSVEFTSRGTIIPASFEKADNGLSGSIIPGVVLEPNTNYRVLARVSFEKYENGAWIASGDIESDTMSTWFQTGNSDPSKIDLSNVAYAYPSPNMTNFYKDEYPTGYLTCTSIPTQAYTVDRSKHTLEVSITGSGVNYTTTNVTLTQGADREISYPLPTNLKPSSSYTLKITKKAINTTYKDEEIISYSFTTSQYSTFSAKVGAISVQKATASDWSVSLPIPRSKDESFSNLELSDLIKFEGVAWPQTFEQQYTSVYGMFSISSTGVNYLSITPNLNYNDIVIGSSDVKVNTWQDFYHDINQAIINMNFDYMKFVNDADPDNGIPPTAAEIDQHKNAIVGPNGVLVSIKPEEAAGKTFSMILKYTLPGEHTSNTTAYLTYKIEK